MPIAWNEYYVTHTGVVGGSGTLLDPWTDLPSVLTNNGTHPITAPAKVNIRAGTAANAPITLQLVSDLVVADRASEGAPVEWIWDDETVWPGINAGFKLMTRNAFGGDIINKQRNSWRGNGVLTYSTPYNGSVFGYFWAGAHCEIEGITFTRETARPSDALSVFAVGDGTGNTDIGPVRFIDCTFRPRSGSAAAISMDGHANVATFEDCTFDFVDSATTQSMFQTVATFDSCLISVIGGQVLNAQATHELCDLGRIKISGLDTGAASVEISDTNVGTPSGDWLDVDILDYSGPNSYLRQRKAGVVQAGLNLTTPFYPTRSAQAPLTGDSTDGVSLRVQPSTTSENISIEAPLRVELPTQRNTLTADARKVLGVHVLADTLWGATLTAENVWVEFRWRDDNGDWQRFSTFDAVGGALTSDPNAGDDWTTTNYPPKSYNGLKFEHTIPVSETLQAGTNIEATLCIGVAAAAGVNLFVDPNIEVSDP